MASTEFVGGTRLLRSRAFAWVGVLVLVAVLGVLVTPGGAWAADDSCDGAGLAKAEVSTSVRLEHDAGTYTKVVTELTVDVPGTWSFARDLLLSEQSRPYVRAMSCLMGDESDNQRWDEVLADRPTVTSRGGQITVVHKAYSWVSYAGEIDIGIWEVEPDAVRKWSVTLKVPSALRGAWWNKITVDPGSPGAERAEPEPRAGDGATALVWRPGRVEQDSEFYVNVTVRPSWQRSWAVYSSHPLATGLDFLGAVLWVTAVIIPLRTAVRRYRQRHWVPTEPQLRALNNLRAWAAVAVMIYALVNADARNGGIPNVALAIVALLLLVARPPRRVVAAACLVALVPSTLIALGIAEAAFGFPFDWEAVLAMNAAASLCLVALILLGIVAVAWRLALDARLLPKSRRFPGRDRVLRVRIAGPAILTATVLIALCIGLVSEHNWQHVSWLSDPMSAGYGMVHRENFLWEASSSHAYVEHWVINDHGWLLTTLAVVAVLRTWHDSTALSPLDDPADRPPFLLLFPVAVGLDVQNYLGTSLLKFLWVPLYMAALYGATKLLAPRSVLAQPFVNSPRRLSTLVGPAARQEILAKARSYREIHAELRRLDQGLFGDTPPQRDRLERRLSRLHNWTLNMPSGATPDKLPAHVSVVDVALALGPRDDWWGNGTRAARFALVPGVPAAVFNTWTEWIRGESWRTTQSDLLGLPGLLTTFLSWTVTFATAGFVLGALWRVLPGRRGAVKALPVAVAFAAPVGLDVLVRWFTRESAANVPLHIAMMLFVLTITAIALDFDTFGSERRYWQSRLGLLLSVYQMRYYSLQVAYLVGQIIAIITIWQFFAEPDAVPYQGEEPPE